MTLQSDFTIDASKFRPEAASNEVKNLNEELIDTMKGGQNCFRLVPLNTGRCERKAKSFSHKLSYLIEVGISLSLPGNVREKFPVGS